MQVLVKLFAGFRDGRFREQLMDLPEGSTPASVAVSLGIDPGEVGIIFINGRKAPEDRKIGEGQKLSLFPVVGGG